jgi:tRNA-Thr(GGU) m(6)t(6)A37 methyltransferase TsaA
MEQIQFIGKLFSPLKEIADCPLQESEGAPKAILKIDERFLPAIPGLNAGDRVILLTWLHKADRNVLTTKPRNNPKAATKGIFATRSPDRPNPIGLHEVEIIEITATGEIIVSNMEVIDGTPVIDIKPVLS